MLLGASLGIPDILFILALMGFAFWKRGWIRIILSIVIIIWGVFAMQYDVKVATALLAIGTALFIIGITNMIQRYREAT